MLQNVTATPARRSLEFGIYRDGDNNLDAIQESTLSQALRTSRTDSRIEFTVEDTTRLRADGDAVVSGTLHTEQYTIADGDVSHVHLARAHEMSNETNLARFVAHTLDNAQASGAPATWIDLVDHGGGDGGGLETRDGRVMSMPNIAKAISDGVALHAREHPEDAGRGVDGVVANQCLMDTMGFADALSRAGVKYLAASPETMLAPGVPSGVAHAIASHAHEPETMAKGIVNDVMRAKYDAGELDFRPAAAFDVLDLDPEKVAHAERSIRQLNERVAAEAREPGVRGAVREDARTIEGMARFPEATNDMPWRADRPAIAFYEKLASDARLSDHVRSDARTAADAIRSLVLSHRESGDFKAFGGSDYSDAVGPTVHLPTSRRQIDPWADSGVTETDNAFYQAVDEDAMTRVIT